MHEREARLLDESREACELRLREWRGALASRSHTSSGDRVRQPSRRGAVTGVMASGCDDADVLPRGGCVGDTCGCGGCVGCEYGGCESAGCECAGGALDGAPWCCADRRAICGSNGGGGGGSGGMVAAEYGMSCGAKTRVLRLTKDENMLERTSFSAMVMHALRLAEEWARGGGGGGHELRRQGGESGETNASG